MSDELTKLLKEYEQQVAEYAARRHIPPFQPIAPQNSAAVIWLRCPNCQQPNGFQRSMCRQYGDQWHVRQESQCQHCNDLIFTTDYMYKVNS